MSAPAATSSKIPSSSAPRKKPAYPELGELRGQNAIVVGDKDVAAAAKVLKTFTAEFKKPAVETGVVDRMVVATEQIDAIADLPSREVLLAKLLGTLQCHRRRQLVRVLNEPASALARVLQAKVDQGGGAPEAKEEAAPEAAAEPAPESSAGEAAAPTPSSGSKPPSCSRGAPPNPKLPRLNPNQTFSPGDRRIPRAPRIGSRTSNQQTNGSSSVGRLPA